MTSQVIEIGAGRITLSRTPTRTDPRRRRLADVIRAGVAVALLALGVAGMAATVDMAGMSPVPEEGPAPGLDL